MTKRPAIASGFFTIILATGIIASVFSHAAASGPARGGAPLHCRTVPGGVPVTALLWTFDAGV